MENDFLIAQVAKLYYIDKMKQNEIAMRYQTTPMQISRILKVAEDEGIVTFHVKMPMPIDVEMGRAIKEKYRLMECIVLQVEDEADIKHAVAKFAADYISNLVTNDTIIGMSWGKTIYDCANSMPYGKNTNCKVVQLAGGISQENNSHITPSNIIQLVSTKLGGIPVFLHAPFSLSTVKAKEELLADSSNRYLMELAEKANIVVIGTGDLSYSSTILETGVLSEVDRKHLLEVGAVGEIGGYPIDREGNEVSWSKSKLYTGVPLEVMKRAESIICLSGEREKVPVLAAAMQTKCFNVLITTTFAGKLLMK